MFQYREGKLYNKINRGGGASKGKEAGALQKTGRDGQYKRKYKRVSINRKPYRVHRLVWIMFNGEISNKYQIDHIDGDTLNNKIDNLRLVTQQENNFNETRAKGYSWHKTSKKWRAQITLNNKQKHLGLFDNKEDARAAYLKAKEEYHIITKKENV